MPKIKIKYFEPSAKIEQHGNWIDVKSSITVQLDQVYTKNKTVVAPLNMIPLGFAMKLPKYYEAHLVPRSSTFKHFSAIQANSIGVIDETYCGEKDQWMIPLIAFDSVIINRGERIGQFRIELSQDAPWYAKLRWLFGGKIKFKEVEHLNQESRGGFGSTGK